MAKKMIFLIFFTLLLILWILYIWAHSKPIIFHGKAQIGEPYFFQEQKVWFSSIIDYCQDKHFIYVLYSNDVVETYDNNGKYCYSVLFERKRNGISSLHCCNTGFIYEDGCDHHYYCISTLNDFEFVPFDTIKHSDLELQLKTKPSDDSAEEDSHTKLSLCGTNLYKQDENGNLVAVTSRPFLLVIVQERFIKSLITVLTISCFVILWFCFKQFNGRLN